MQCKKYKTIILNQDEDYFRITKKGHTHILSDKISVQWKELIVLPVVVFIPLLYLIGWFPGLVMGILAGVGYAIYRYASSIKYKEIHIDEETGRMSLVYFFKGKVSNEELITEKYDATHLVFTERSRSGTTKFIMTYKTHVDSDLLIIKSRKDKEYLEDYYRNEIKIKQG